MPKYRTVALLLLSACFFGGAFSVISAEKLASQTLENEQTLWNLEHEYWRYVQDNNLSAYSALWHKNFLGWPSVSPTPVRKDHITDWITSQTSKGFTFESGELKPAAIQMNGDTAVVCYWMTYKWLDKDGKGSPHTIRVTHTWLRDGQDWKIIGGMSMLEAEAPSR
jgi:hypothetical protein